MQFTLFLTERCNLSCSYCYQARDPKDMTFETAKKAVDLAVASSGDSVGIAFFGGEPLLKKDLVREIVAYCRSKEAGALRFFFKMTTNGLLLDEDFLDFANKENVFLGISLDGDRSAQDKNRVFQDGSGSFDLVSNRADLLLRKQPNAPVLMTVTPNTVGHYCDNVRFLWEKGFRYLICSLDFSANWSDADLKVLKKQYQRMAELYKTLIRKEEKFYLSPFEVKISSRILGDGYFAERCELGKKQISVAPNGKLYPCVQFLHDEDYCIGDVENGFDDKKRANLYLRSEATKGECEGCAIVRRCNCHCGCLNKQVTGSIDHVPAILCEHERMLLPIADRLAETLYKERNGMFIQKHYNDIYPIISMLEDLR